MERVKKQVGETESSRRAVQVGATSRSREGEIAQRIDASPAMVAQRKKLHSLFGGSIQLQRTKDGFLHGNPGAAQLKEDRIKADSNGAIQLATSIQYGNPAWFEFNGSKDLVGTSMNAHLDPNEVRVGSDTNSSVAFSEVFRNLTQNTPTTWVRGHLLNHDLGGIANINNLFPISTAANNEHKYEVEYPVKHWLNQSCEIDYTVTAQKDAPTDPTSADGTFFCDARVTSDPKNVLNGQRVEKAIHSKSQKVSWTRLRKGNKSQQTKSFASVDHGSNNTVFRDTYKSPKPRTGWEHRRGTVSDNYYVVDGEKTNLDEGVVATLLKLESDARTILMDFFGTGYKVVGIKGIDEDVLGSIVEEVMSEANSLEEQLKLTAEALEDEGYTVIKPK